MSVPNAGLAAAATSGQAEDAINATAELAVVDTPEDVRPVAPDQFDPEFETSKAEIWSYYTYYVGNNGLALFNFAPTIFQDLLSQAAGDSGRLRFLGANRTINSVVLAANGMSFAIQIVLFLIIGSFADYGVWRPYILITSSVAAWAIGFGWLGVHTENKWKVAIGLYMAGLVAYQICVTFWTAAHSGLARNTAEMRRKAEELEDRKIDRDEYDAADSLMRGRLQNQAFIWQSCGEVVILAVLVGILFALDVNASVANNLRGLSVLIAFVSGVWLLLAIPWFWFEKRRPGQTVPRGMNPISVGFLQLWRAIRHIWRLRQTLVYLVGYFLLGDSLNTTVTLISTLQNTVVSYNTLTLTYLLIVGIATQAVGIGVFWKIQKRFNLSTKNMFDVIMIGIIILDVWGMIGIWTQKFGFHNEWEFWLYQVFYGFFVCPWYSYSQIMISEVTPRGKEFLFFSLFSIMGKTSAFIGPLVSSAIIDASPSGNNSLPFYFLLALSVVSFFLLFFFVDLKKSRVEQEKFLANQMRTAQSSPSAAEEGESTRALAKGSSGSVHEDVSKSGSE